MRIAMMILAAVVLAGGIAPAAANTSGNPVQLAKLTPVRAGDSVPASNNNGHPSDNNGHKGRHHGGPPVLPVCSDSSSGGISATCKAPVSPQ
jgi:hypothetical protein